MAHGGQAELHPLADAAVRWQGGVITWVGPEKDLPDEMASDEHINAEGGLVIPALVDCHTHLAFGGWRSDEFVQRIQGASYLDIARAGGGIQRTVEQTSALSLDALTLRATHFIERMTALGILTVEAKSGYGLSVEAELRQLRSYQRLRERTAARVVPTFLAHTIPTGWQSDRHGYVKMIVDELLPGIRAEGLATFCDVFVEDTAFSPGEARTILQAAKDLGFELKVHADQMSDSGGAELAAELGARSADHLERVSKTGIEALARSGTVAVSLPFATLYLGMRPIPARSLIGAGVPVAVATDFNPGSAPSYHLPFAMTLACLLQRMTPEEVLKGATVFAAMACGLESDVGSVEVGKSADLLIVDSGSVNEWLYHVQENAVRTVICRGKVERSTY
jgi:imidazolonepropionase